MTNNKISAQPFDCMQYFYSDVQKPLIRALIRFSGHMNETILKKAVCLSINVIPLINCCFDEKDHCWKKRKFKADDIVHVVEVQEGDDDPTEKLLLSSVDIMKGPQLRIFLVRKMKYDVLCIIINHMISDGAGFKEYLYVLSNIYSQFQKNINFSTKLYRNNKRNLGQLLKNISFKEKINILFSKSDSHKLDRGLILPLKGDKSKPFVVIRCLNKEYFLKIRNFAKIRNVSINDMLLTTYMRALYKITGHTSITVPCPVDLRKYKGKDQICGICNLTGSYICHATIKPSDTFNDTLKIVSKQMKINKSSNNCLKKPMMFHMLFHIVSFRTLKKLFYKLSSVPVTSYTNLGIINADKLCFDKLDIDDAFISTAVKYAPYFQVSISTYKNCCTMTSSFHGTKEDRKTIEGFFDCMECELNSIF